MLRVKSLQCSTSHQTTPSSPTKLWKYVEYDYGNMQNKYVEYVDHCLTIK